MGIQRWRIKLVLSKVDLSAINRTNFLKVDFKKIRRSPFGKLYAALQVGPKLLAWDEGSLVLPTDIKDFRDYRAILYADIDSIDMNSFGEDLLKRVCECCCKWNTERSNSIILDYNQTFVEDLIDAMNLRGNYSKGELGKFLKKLIGSNKPEEVTFSYQNETFKNHEQLDEYCYKMEPQYRSDLYWLLKAFDRVMWSRYFAAQQELEENNDFDGETPESLENQISLWSPCNAGCYFQNPFDTGSIIGEN